MNAHAASSGKQIEVFLQPGEYFVGDAGYRIRTVLGSCVSVTLWNPLRRIGAMSHFLLAARVRTPAQGATLSGNYGDEALSLMLRDLARMKLEPAQCQAKIFGGGEMFPEHRARDPFNIGKRNGEAARNLLQAQGIEVISESLFGEGHRQIIFDVATGHVWSRQLPPNPNMHSDFAPLQQNKTDTTGRQRT